MDDPRLRAAPPRDFARTRVCAVLSTVLVAGCFDPTTAVGATGSGSGSEEGGDTTAHPPGAPDGSDTTGVTSNTDDGVETESCPPAFFSEHSFDEACFH